MIRLFIFVVCGFLFFSCVDNSNKNQAMDQNVEKEIRDRIVRIKEYAQKNDTVFIDPDEVDKKVRDMILLSKDVENLGASVNLSNQYFNGLCIRFNLNSTDFEKLNTGMHVNDIASVLKRNEMIFFNHILLKSGTDAIPMHTAQ